MSANTDLSAYGPVAITQESSILVIEAAQSAVTIANVLTNLLSPEQRQTSRLAELPATSATSRWVLEMLQLQAVSVLLLLEPTLRSQYSISVVSEGDLSPYERVVARETASLASWGIGITSPTTGITISPTMFSGSDHSTNEGPAQTMTGTGMELDEDAGVVSEEFIDDHDGLPSPPPSPPAAAPAPAPPNSVTTSMRENGIWLMWIEMMGGMAPSTRHPEIVGQELDEDEDDMDEEQLETKIGLTTTMLELDAHVSSTGSGSLDVMEMTADHLQDLGHPPGT